MSPGQDSGQVARQLQDVAAELDQVTRQVRGAQERVQVTLGSSATGADKQMLAALNRVAAPTREAQQALSAAAGALRKRP